MLQVIATVSATDADDAENSDVEYQLMNEAGQLFAIDAQT